MRTPTAAPIWTMGPSRPPEPPVASEATVAKALIKPTTGRI